MKDDGSRPVRKIVSQISGMFLIPKVMERRFKRMSWSTESKAALTSNRARSVHDTIDVRQEAEKEGFSRVTLTEPGLTWRKEIISVQIAKQLTSYQFFNNFRNEGNIS